MSVCSACKFQVVDISALNCPNCGASLKNPEKAEDEVEQNSPHPESQADNSNKDIGLSTSNPPRQADTEDDSLEICDPGEFLCSVQPGSDIPQENSPIGQTTPPPLNESADEGAGFSEPPNNASGKIQKLSDEQVDNIRSNMLNSESEYVSAQDASSIMHDLSQSTDGPNLERKNTGLSSRPDDKAALAESVNRPNSPADKSEGKTAMSAPKSAPMRKVAYFHKNFIQLTGSIHPSSGEELVIEDRHYLLKQKKIKPQYAIGIFSILVAVLLFVIGKQFITPTMPGSGSIIGVMLDESGRPLITGSEIALPETGKKITSDALGFFRFDKVPTGVYVIRYTLDDGRIGTDNISVANGEITLLSLATDEARKDPSVATASLGGGSRPVSVRQMNNTENMPPVPEEKKSQVADNSNPQKEYSALKLKTNVDGAKLIANGQTLGVGNMTYKKLAPGKHKVRITKNGYKAWSGNVQLKPSETYTLSVNLDKIETETEEQTYSANDFYQSGQTMLNDGNIEAAIQDFSEAISMQPSMADAYMDRAGAYSMSGKTNLAEADYIRAGEIYSIQKRNESALAALGKALDINDKSVAALINRGDLYRRMDVKDKAIDDYKSVIKYDKNNLRANFDLGKMYFSAGNHKNADKLFRKAREIDSRNPEIYHYLMLNYFARDDFDKVKKIYGDFKDNVSTNERQAFKENPRFDAILRIVGEYERP